MATNRLLRRIGRVRRSNFGKRRFIVYRCDVRSIDPARVPAKCDAVFRVNCEEGFKRLSSGDERYGLTRRAIDEIPLQRDQGEWCITGWCGDELAYYGWAQFKRRTLAPRSVVPIGPGRAFLYRCFTVADFRGLGLYPAGLAFACARLAEDRVTTALIDHEDDNIGSARGVQKLGMQEVGCYHVHTLFRLRWATMDELTRREITG